MINTDNITINTHSSIRIAGDKIIYFDPFEIKEENHDADVIFVTHDHYDHFDVKSIANIVNENTIIVAPESMQKMVTSKTKIDSEKCAFLKPDSVIDIEGLKVETVRAYNKMKPFHPKNKGFLGYVVTLEGVRYYVAGDTDFNDDVAKVQCDVALVPVGGTYTMDKKHAAEAVVKIMPKVAIPTHYGSVAGKSDDGEGFAELVKASGLGIDTVIKI